jgi:hypothetical protein
VMSRSPSAGCWPEDNGQLGPDRSGGVASFPMSAAACCARSGPGRQPVHYAAEA